MWWERQQEENVFSLAPKFSIFHLYFPTLKIAKPVGLLSFLEERRFSRVGSYLKFDLENLIILFSIGQWPLATPHCWVTSVDTKIYHSKPYKHHIMAHVFLSPNEKVKRKLCAKITSLTYFHFVKQCTRVDFFRFFF